MRPLRQEVSDARIDEIAPVTSADVLGRWDAAIGAAALRAAADMLQRRLGAVPVDSIHVA